MDNAIRYRLTGEEYRNSLKFICGSSSKFRVIPGKKIKILIIAAILLLLSVLAVTAYEMNKYDIIEFPDHYSVVIGSEHRIITDEITVEYLPDDYVLINTEKNKFSCVKEFGNNTENLIITKRSSYDSIDIDSEHGTISRINIDGVEYMLVPTGGNWIMVAWEKNNYFYTASGNMDKQTLLDIVISIQ